MSTVFATNTISQFNNSERELQNFSKHKSTHQQSVNSYNNDNIQLVENYFDHSKDKAYNKDIQVEINNSSSNLFNKQKNEYKLSHDISNDSRNNSYTDEKRGMSQEFLELEKYYNESFEKNNNNMTSLPTKMLRRNLRDSSSSVGKNPKVKQKANKEACIDTKNIHKGIPLT